MRLQPGMRGLRSIAALAALVVLMLLAAAASLLAVLWNTVPASSGTIGIAGLNGPVDIIRDREGVPHIFATTVDDLGAALGFVHAQERLWQMELMRRAGQGRLSEIFGERTVASDIFLRTLDLNGHAERSFAALPQDSKALLEAHARGVNAFINQATSSLAPRLPPEFLLLRHRPEPWRPVDGILAAKMMALTLGTNLDEEIARLSYSAEGLNSAEITDLMPGLEGEDAPPLPELTQLYALRRLAGVPSPTTAELDAFPVGGASNNWVVSGARTRSGKPLLANDPHLRLSAPSLWYLAHLALVEPGAAALNIVGASLPGTPLIVLGRSDAIAWGFTTTGADVQDLFIEKINPSNPSEYLTPQGWRRFQEESMAIHVRGSGTRIVERRTTRHGPVLPGSYGNLGAMLDEGYVAALQWTALSDDDTTFAAGTFDPQVRNVASYMDKMRLYVVPMQNMVVADATGSIGLIAPGRVPVRNASNAVAGRAPVPGWDPTYDWQGYLRFDELPRVEDPPAGAIGTSNTRIVGSDYSHHLTFDWEAPYRQQRIKELVLDRSNHDVETMRLAQLDVLSLAFAQLKPLMLASARAAGGAENGVLDRLETWDTRMRAETAEPLIFTAWVRETVKGIWSDDLGPAFDRYFDAHVTALIRVLQGRARARDWCDNRATPIRESCATVVANALEAALADLQRRYGSDRTRWTWGRAHFAYGEHRPFGLLPLVGSYFNVMEPSPGGDYTLNRGKSEFGEEPPFANRYGSSYRAIYDLADLDRSLYIQSTGQSGNPFSPFYRSFAIRWARGEYIRIPTSREEIGATAVGIWRLEPALRSGTPVGRPKGSPLRAP